MSKTITKRPTLTELNSLHRLAVDLTAFLEVIYAAMPDDTPEQPAAYRHLVCMAHVKADELQEWLDGVASRVAGGTHG
ncbi:hypothetical protein ACLO87_15675 [Paenalcaligenes sp. Me52]|uniref:hypothetical protein n=1 Tax=Paenalcaligenes sp. Me52 TaxID=3392038 RepID=UPI003D28CD7D